MTSWLPEPLQTEHVILRPTQHGDEEWIIRSFTNPEVRRYLGGAMSEADARTSVRISGEWWGHFAVVDREHAQAMGCVSFENKNGLWDLSYHLQPEFWGRGLATEALKVALLWFFSATTEDEVSAVTQIANHSSCKLLERLGAHPTKEFIYHKGDQGTPVRQYSFYRWMFGNSEKLKRNSA